jgi:hypothetical protein
MSLSSMLRDPLSKVKGTMFQVRLDLLLCSAVMWAC